MTAKSLPQSARGEDECELPQADQNIATKRGHLIPLPRAHSGGSASFLRWQAALSDQPANGRHRGYGRWFRRGWPGGPVFASVHGLDAADGQVRGFPGCESIGRT